MTRSQLCCEAKDISRRGWGLAGGKGSLHTGIILLFNMALPCYQPVSPKVEPYHFPFSLPLCPPSPCRWISSIAWGQLQPQCLLLPLALPCKSPVESLKTERLWPEAVGLSLWGSRSSSSILHPPLSQDRCSFQQERKWMFIECLLCSSHFYWYKHYISHLILNNLTNHYFCR